MTFEHDRIVLAPPDIDLERSPLRGADLGETFVLGTLNPGFTRLPNGNLLMMVRIAEALREPIRGDHIHAIRWCPNEGFVTDAYELATVDASDPRKFRLLAHTSRVMALTSLSWLLPVELDAAAEKVVQVHYDKAIIPGASYQEYGIEDARISRIGDRWYMTTCSVSAERHSTTLYTSENGLDYVLQGVILDHQNKDMLFFEGMPAGKFHALTRPLGDLYFAYPPGSTYEAGPSINLASSPDGLHWKPADTPLIRPRRGSSSVLRIGGGAPPVLTPNGWLMLYHGVQPGTIVGTYRTFHAFLDSEMPSKVLAIDDEMPLLEPRPELSDPWSELSYLQGVVFTTGIVEDDHDYIVASGEDDLLCRITFIPKSVFEPAGS
ncbi:glycosidase [Luteolibacter luteus]|uniref:Glycosidase n=1 Tax=Luteolibacter luteus TaxID=2728835 RepID=A0A858RDI6_9BACT|nr:glycosidase [Luteolibacter luteus]QJE95136.1 glycosidase [Luteolibacter luteus]